MRTLRLFAVIAVIAALVSIAGSSNGAAESAPNPSAPQLTQTQSTSNEVPRGLWSPVADSRCTALWAALLWKARQFGWQGRLKGSISGLRSFAEQDYLYQLFVSGRGAPAFNPNGPSRHLEHNVARDGEWSQAVDVTEAGALIRAAAAFGVRLHQPYPDEPWHVEAVTPFAL